RPRPPPPPPRGRPAAPACPRRHPPPPPPPPRRGGGRRPAVARATDDGGRGYLGAHDAGTTTRWPAASPGPVACTRPAASSNMPSRTGTSRCTPRGVTSSTAYPPLASASSAVT